MAELGRDRIPHLAPVCGLDSDSKGHSRVALSWRTVFLVSGSAIIVVDFPLLVF
jgi:hypothetical protein